MKILFGLMLIIAAGSCDNTKINPCQENAKSAYELGKVAGVNAVLYYELQHAEGKIKSEPDVEQYYHFADSISRFYK